MPSEPPRRTRRSVRLRAHGYAGGLYFVTACTYGRRPLFGDVADDEMALSRLGQIAHDEWLRTGDARASVVLDAFVVMPDHVHLLFGIVTDGCDGMDDRRGTARRAPTQGTEPRRSFAVSGIGTVPTVVRAYKSAVTRAVNAARQSPGTPVWQRGYYDRVVRSDREAEAIRRYIVMNPARWRRRATDRRDGHRI